jgi:hypothetical protein
MELRKYFVDNLEAKKRAERTAGTWNPASQSSLIAAASATEAREIANQLLKDFDAGKLKVPKEDTEKAFKDHLISIKKEMRKSGKMSLSAALKEQGLDGILKDARRLDQEFEIAVWMLAGKASECEKKALRR